jgi:hypothetical protein
MAVLRLERGHHRQYRLHEPGPLSTLGANTPLAPQHPRPNRPLRLVVRGRHPCIAHQGPQGRPPLADLPRQGPSVFGTPQCWPTSARCSTSRRMSGMLVRKLACVSVLARTRWHPWAIRRASTRRTFPTSADRPPRLIMASRSCNRCAQDHCHRQLGDQLRHSSASGPPGYGATAAPRRLCPTQSLRATATPAASRRAPLSST